MVSEVYYEIEVHMTRFLHTARINYVDSVMSSRGIGIFFLVPRSWQDEKKFLYFFTGLKTYYLSYSIYNTNVHINISVRG